MAAFSLAARPAQKPAQEPFTKVEQILLQASMLTACWAHANSSTHDFLLPQPATSLLQQDTGSWCDALVFTSLFHRLYCSVFIYVYRVNILSVWPFQMNGIS